MNDHIWQSVSPVPPNKISYFFRIIFGMKRNKRSISTRAMSEDPNISSMPDLTFISVAEKTRIEMTGNDVVRPHADHPAAMTTAGVPRVGVIIGTITGARLGDPHAEAIMDQITEEQLNQICEI